jgi:hypothetical protein
MTPLDSSGNSFSSNFIFLSELVVCPRESLCTELVASVLDENFLFWTGDVRSAEGMRCTYELGATSFPFLGIVCSLNTSAMMQDSMKQLGYGLPKSGRILLTYLGFKGFFVSFMNPLDLGQLWKIKRFLRQMGLQLHWVHSSRGIRRFWLLLRLKSIILMHISRVP